MKENDKKQPGFPLNTIRLCVDRYEEDIEGRLYSKLCSRGAGFQSCSGMFRCAEQLFDWCGYPQNFQEKRSFRNQNGHTRRRLIRAAQQTDEELCQKQGEYQTFNLIVWSRMSAGWQGRLLYSDGERAGDFSSELGLLRCLCRALRKEGR